MAKLRNSPVVDLAGRITGRATMMGWERFGIASALAGSLMTAGLQATPVSAAPPENLALYVLAGQSNMSGRGDVGALPLEFQAASPLIWMYANDGSWRAAREPVDDPAGQIDPVSRDDEVGVGPGLSFARTIANANPGRPVGLIPCAKGATSLDDWLAEGGRETLSGSCAARVEEARAHGSLEGLLWYQGESDAHGPEAAARWPERFALWIERMRARLQAPDLPVVAVVLGAISDGRRTDPRFAAWDAVKAAQRSTRIAGVAWVEAEDCPLDSQDGLHLSTEGQLCLGPLLARAMMDLPAAHPKDPGR